jgi:hypothetical protein
LKNLIVIVLTLSLLSCATGPVYIAKTESEGIKSSYDDIQLRNMYQRNQSLLREVYARLTSSHINICPEGLGFTALPDNANGRHNYLMVNIRPQEIVFDMNVSRADQRVSLVLGEYLEKYFTYVKMSDIQSSGAEGLSLGMYWPVRDYSQCQKNGGFVEYLVVSLSKDDLNNIFEGKTTLKNLLSTKDIIASLDLKEAVHMKSAYQ